MKKFLLITLTFAFLFSPGLVLAKNNDQVANQNQIKVQNEGEESQIQLSNQQEQQTQQEESLESEPSFRSEKAEEHMSIVAEKVEELLLQNKEIGIGKEIREVARNQNEIKENVAQQFKLLEEREGFLRRFLGPNRKALKNLGQQMQQNQLQIEKLEEAKEEATRLSEKALVQEMIEGLSDANDIISFEISKEERIPGIIALFLSIFKTPSQEE